MKQSVLSVLLALSIGGAAKAADTVNITILQPQLSPETIRYVVNTERRNIFRQAMPLTGKDSETFWKLYDAYEKEKKGLDDKRQALAADYIAKYDTLTNEQSLKMMKDTAEINQKLLKLREKYAERIGQQVSGIMGARFWQIDNYIAATFQIAWLNNVPLMGDKVISRSEGK